VLTERDLQNVFYQTHVGTHVLMFTYALDVPVNGGFLQECHLGSSEGSVGRLLIIGPFIQFGFFF
jgi:hypothetical protein